MSTANILGPGDPPPTSRTAAFAYDYRYTLPTDDARKLSFYSSKYRLGSFIDVRTHIRVGDVGLSVEQMVGPTLIVGPTQAGKTTSLIAPWLATAIANGWSAVAVDVKGDLMAAVGRCLRLRGRYDDARTIVLDARGRGTASWQWVKDATSSPTGREAVVASLLGRAPPRNISDPALWHRDVRYLRGLLELAAHRRLESAQDLLRVLRSRDALEDALASMSQDNALADLLQFDLPDDFARRTEVISAMLDGVVSESAASSDARAFELASFFREPTFLCVLSPVAEEPRSASFAGLALTLLLEKGYRHFGAPPARPVLLAVDEAARMANRLNLEEIASYSAGAGLRPVFALQDLAQAQQPGGMTSQLSTLASNATTMIVMEGSSPATAAGLIGRLGRIDVPFRDRTVTNWQSFNPSHTDAYRLEQRSALGEREITAPPFGPRTAVVHARKVSNLPFLVDLTRGDLRAHSI